MTDQALWVHGDDDDGSGDDDDADHDDNDADGNKTISDGGITVDFWIIKVHTSNW